jgi:predicted ABC-type sugar transport system permease subunit
LLGWWTTPVARALLALLLMIVIGSIFSADGAFFRWSVHRDMLRQVSVHGMLACGMTVVIITAGIDLSVSSLLALAAVSFAWLTLPQGWPAVLAIPLVLAFGTALRYCARLDLRRAGRPNANPAVHRHAGDDGLRAGIGEGGLRRQEDHELRDGA